MADMQDLIEKGHRRAIAWAIALMSGTEIIANSYEVDLLECYARGTVSLSEMLLLLDSRVHHILYRSRATKPLTLSELTALLEESRAWNDRHGITGLLCYTQEGYFVQLLEGPVLEVKSLYAKIRQDARHHDVTTLSEKANETRWFADWQMAYTEVESNDFFWLLDYFEVQSHRLVKPVQPISNPHLCALLSGFSQLQPAHGDTNT